MQFNYLNFLLLYPRNHYVIILNYNRCKRLNQPSITIYFYIVTKNGYPEFAPERAISKLSCSGDYVNKTNCKINIVHVGTYMYIN